VKNRKIEFFNQSITAARTSPWLIASEHLELLPVKKPLSLNSLVIFTRNA